jgi:hypothetical protein
MTSQTPGSENRLFLALSTFFSLSATAPLGALLRLRCAGNQFSGSLPEVWFNRRHIVTHCIRFTTLLAGCAVV